MAREAAAAGFAGIVLQTHSETTTGRASAAAEAAPQLSVLGGITLNEFVAGVSVKSVRAQIAAGAAFVWFPTIDALAHITALGGPGRTMSGVHDLLDTTPGISVVDADGRLTRDAIAVVDAIASRPVFVGTGHLSLEEVTALAEVAEARGVPIVINHPFFLVHPDARWWHRLSPNAVVQFAALADASNPLLPPIERVLEVIALIGPERCAIGSGNQDGQSGRCDRDLRPPVARSRTRRAVTARNPDTQPKPVLDARSAPRRNGKTRRGDATHGARRALSMSPRAAAGSPRPLAAALDRTCLERRMLELGAFDTSVDPGYDTLMPPRHSKLERFRQLAVLPALEALHLAKNATVDALGNTIVVLGSGAAPQLCVVNYVPTQHANEMDDPYPARIERRGSVVGVRGRGTTQNRTHQAVMLCVLESLTQTGARLAGTLIWVVNNECRSTHDCSASIDTSDFRPRGLTPDFVVMQLPNGLSITAGNRGRVVVHVRIERKPTHSSVPAAGKTVIDLAADAVVLLRSLSWAHLLPHPRLGGRQAVPYQLHFEPVAPHTIPSVARIVVDRRMLPGDDAEAAAAEIRDLLAPIEGVEVSAGATMLPSLVDRADAWLTDLADAVSVAHGSPAKVIDYAGSFDAGYWTARGIPAVMFGAGAGSDLLHDDFVTTDEAFVEARAIARLIENRLMTDEGVDAPRGPTPRARS